MLYTYEPGVSMAKWLSLQAVDKFCLRLTEILEIKYRCF